MKHKLYNRLLSLALAVGLVVGMLPGSAAVSVTEGSAGQPVTLGNGDQVSFTLPVKLYGDDGTDLSSAGAVEISIQNGGTVSLPGDYTKGIESISSGNKTYKFSYVADSMNGSAVSELKAGMLTETKTSTEGGGWTDDWKEVTTITTNTYIVWYGNKPTSTTASNIIASRSSSNSTTQRYERKWDWGWSDWYKVGNPTTTETPLSAQSNKKTIHFMYDKDGTLVPVKELTRDKIVTLNDDGTYDLTLTVSGAAGSITNPQKLDVVFIVDKSGSMAWDMNHDDGSWGHQDPDADETPRLTAVKNAIRQIASELDSSETIDARYSLVSFSGSISGWDEDYYTYNDATVNQTWTDNLNTFTNQLNRISADGGTNYEAGLYSANQELLDSTRPGAMTAVIFLSDGEPTFYYDRDGYTTGSGSSYSQQAMDDAKAEAAKMAVDFFYAIGVGDSYDEQDRDYADTLMPVYMQNLVSGATQAKSTQFFDGNNSDALNNIFDQIGGDITSILCENVTVTDTLSENVEIAAGEGVPVDDSLLTITVTNKAGDTVATGRGSVYLDSDKVSITAHYDPATRQITLNFPPDYKLNKDYTYMVTAPIRATEKAYENYRNNGNQYPDTGDQGTGTHAGQLGLYTNNKATVDYTYNGKNYSAEYPMPVIQLKPGTLTITKRITGDLENTDITALEDDLTFTVNLNGEESSYKLNEFTPGANNTYSLTIKGLSPVTDYTVTESNATVTGYTLQTTKENDTGTVTKGGSATAQFVNDYQNTKNEYPVRFYLEGIKPGSAKDYPYSDAWAKLNSWLSGGFANVTTSQNPMTNFDSLEGEAGYDDSVSGGSVAGGIAGHTNVVTWLNKYHVAPAIDVNDISAVLTELVKMYPEIANAPVTSVGGKEYTVNEIINNPSDFQIVYTQVTKNHDKLLEYYKGNGSLQQGQDSYHVHLSVRKNPGNLTITKTFSGVESLPSNFAIKVTDSVNAPVDTLTLQEATYNPETKTYTWTLENLNEDTYTVTETGTNVDNMVLSATINVTDNDTATPENVKDTTAKVKVADNETSTVDITNTYTPADGYLKIVKKIEGGAAFNDGRDTFTFKVTAQSGKDAGKVWYFTIKGEGLVVEKFKLPVGDYKVEELSNINYKSDYTVEGLNQDGVVTISNSNTETNPATVTFTNTPDKTDIPTDGGGVKNVPGTDNDGKFVWKPEQYGNKGKIEEDPETTE